MPDPSSSFVIVEDLGPQMLTFTGSRVDLQRLQDALGRALETGAGQTEGGPCLGWGGGVRFQVREPPDGRGA